ncbi:MAG: twin-arginine translocase TatA/TatE family subunit [Microbacterium sp.]
MFSNLTGWHALIILAVVLLIFGAAKLPALAKSVGQSMRILKDEVHEEKANAAPQVTVSASVAQPAASADEPVTTAIPAQPVPLRVASE